MDIAQLIEEGETADRLLGVVDQLPNALFPLSGPRVTAGARGVAVVTAHEGRHVKRDAGAELLDFGLGLSEPEIAKVADLRSLEGVERKKVHVHKTTECRFNPFVDTKAARELELKRRMELISTASELLLCKLYPVSNVEKSGQSHDGDQEIFRIGVHAGRKMISFRNYITDTWKRTWGPRTDR